MPQAAAMAMPAKHGSSHGRRHSSAYMSSLLPSFAHATSASLNTGLTSAHVTASSAQATTARRANSPPSSSRVRSGSIRSTPPSSSSTRMSRRRASVASHERPAQSLGSEARKAVTVTPVAKSSTAAPNEPEPLLPHKVEALPNVFEFLDEERTQHEDSTSDESDAEDAPNPVNAHSVNSRKEGAEELRMRGSSPRGSCHSDSGISMEDGSPRLEKRRIPQVTKAEVTPPPSYDPPKASDQPKASQLRSRRWSQESKASGDLSFPESYYLQSIVLQSQKRGQLRSTPSSSMRREARPPPPSYRHSWVDDMSRMPGHGGNGLRPEHDLGMSVTHEAAPLQPKSQSLIYRNSEHNTVRRRDCDAESTTSSSAQTTTSTASPAIFRRFDALSRTVLNHLQHEISALEHELHRLEEVESHCQHQFQHPHIPPAPISPRLQYQKAELIAHINGKLQQYNAALSSYARMARDFGPADTIEEQEETSSLQDSVMLTKTPRPQVPAPQPMVIPQTIVQPYPPLLNPLTFILSILLLVLAFSETPKPLARLIVMGSVVVAVLIMRERNPSMTASAMLQAKSGQQERSRTSDIDTVKNAEMSRRDTSQTGPSHTCVEESETDEDGDEEEEDDEEHSYEE